jgi:hypothetical protein
MLPLDLLSTPDVVFFLDVDNTLIDTDRFVANFRTKVEGELGVAGAADYWSVYADHLQEKDYVDYLGALQAYRLKYQRGRSDISRLLRISGFLLDYPFLDLVYPRALEVIEVLNRFGETVILSDGDVVFQPRKIQHSGLWDAVFGRVLIYVHKETMLDSIEQIFPAKRYIMVDDKPRVLSAMKAILKERLISIMPRQGHYALDLASVASYTPADLTIERIGDLLDIDIAGLLNKRSILKNELER